MTILAMVVGARAFGIPGMPTAVLVVDGSCPSTMERPHATSWKD